MSPRAVVVGVALLGLAVPARPAPAAEEPKEPPRPLRLLEFTVEEPAVRRVVERYSVSRAVDPVRFAGRREDAELLLDRLALAAALGRRLHPDLEPYRITEKGPDLYEVEEPGALRGVTRLVAKAPGRRVYLAEGEFRSLAHLLRFEGAMVVTLRYREEEGEGGRPHLATEPHLYVKIENVVVHAILKLLSPIIHAIIDRRVARLAAAAEAVSARLLQDPGGLYRDMQGWPDVTEGDREAFRRHFGLPGEP